MKIKNTFIILAFCTMFFTPLLWKGTGAEASAQNVGISPTGSPPNASAGLDVDFTNKGLLIPRVSLTSLTDAATIATPATSLLVYNTNAALSGGAGYYYNAGTSVSPLWVKFLNTGAGTAASDAWLTKGNSGTTTSNFLGTSDNVSLRIRTNNLERMYIDSATGNVGIGTTTPRVTLDINPSVNGNIMLGTQGRNSHIWMLGGSDGTNTSSIYMYDSIGALGVILSDGKFYHSCVNCQGTSGINFGVGTAAPGATLQVGQGVNYAQIAHADGRHYFEAQNSVGTNAFEIYVQHGSSTTRGFFNVKSNIGGTGVSHLYVHGNGNVGIGTTTPLTTLHVANNVNGWSIFVDPDKTNGAAAPGMAFGKYAGVAAIQTFTNVNLAINPAGGNVGIGCTIPQYALHVIGDIASSATIRGVNAYVTGAITACSDIRYKKDVIPLPNALTNVMKLQGVNYHWKVKEFPDKNFSNEKQIGFIAQEIEKIYPEVVVTDKDGYKSVDYSRLTPVLVEAMKEQQKAIEKLELENKSLKANSELRIAKLEAAMQKLMKIANTEETRK